ncbi:MAG: CPBP family intramembrane metalloprotease [Clostridium sp.]|nr:CPBP family intramembrane metalloprotease [Clostridium sp.]
MLRLYLSAKLISILIIIAIILKIITKISPFNKYDYNIRRAKKSGILSLIVISIYIIIGIVYLIILKKYFMNYPAKDILFMQSVEYLLELSLVIAIVILTKEGIASLSVTKNNVFKSIIVGIFSGVIYFVLIKNTFKINETMNIISLDSFYNFIFQFIVGFVEETIFRGYLQTRLTYWLGTLRGWLLTSAIFTLSHLPNYLILGGMNFYSLLIIVFLGLLLGYTRIKTKSIIAGSIFHALLNWLGRIIHIVG